MWYALITKVLGIPNEIRAHKPEGVSTEFILIIY